MYLCMCSFSFSRNTPTHMSSLYFLHTNEQPTKHFPIKGVPTYKHMKPSTLSPSSRFFPYLFFFFSFLQRAFIEDQTNSRYLHPLGLFSHSTVVLWYWRAGKGTRLSLSGSLREHCFHLDKYLASNVPQERPTCTLGDWCAVGDKKDMWRTPERLYHIFRFLLYFGSQSLMPFGSSHSKWQRESSYMQQKFYLVCALTVRPPSCMCSDVKALHIFMILSGISFIDVTLYKRSIIIYKSFNCHIKLKQWHYIQ